MVQAGYLQDMGQEGIGQDGSGYPTTSPLFPGGVAGVQHGSPSGKTSWVPALISGWTMEVRFEHTHRKKRLAVM
jgi:hypothetical protein